MTPGFPSAATYPVQAMFFDGVSNRMLAPALAAAKGSAVTAVAIESAAIIVIFMAGFLIVYGFGVRCRFSLPAAVAGRAQCAADALADSWMLSSAGKHAQYRASSRSPSTIRICRRCGQRQNQRAPRLAEHAAGHSHRWHRRKHIQGDRWSLDVVNCTAASRLGISRM